ncbi:MAG TPA: SusD/RagB family nutrient-binding outer membrane lipoprotein [Gemmatimonadaceae bacterium]|nr:SusD/RagB family nutrient-binding outer membrane lipoprotein [Gemmatimonadaceae bacterium]
MRNRDYLLVVAASAALLGAAACNNDGLTSLNKNPNSPEDVPAATIFTNAARTAVARWIGNGYDLRGTEWVAQHLAEVQYPDEDDYKRLQASSTTPWFDTPYSSELEDFRKIYQKGQAANEPGTWAPAVIMRTLVFSYLTNTFGDIPYFQALAGDSTGASLTPAYDKQQDIYADFFKQLDAAAKALGGASNTLGGADPIYAGNTTKWQKFANSLRLRLAMQIINIDAATANTQIAAALAPANGGVFTSNADNAQLNWPGDGVYNNPWSDNFSGRDDHRMSQTFMNLMIGMKDPRVFVFSTRAKDDTLVPAANNDSTFLGYAGMPNGLTQSTASPYFNDTSRPGLIFWPPANLAAVKGGFGKTTPTYIMTYAEVQFIKAEADNRSLGGQFPANAQAHYDSGIAASFAQWGIPVADTTAYLAQPSVAYVAGTPGLIKIDQQEWIALYTDGGTTWSLWRRTCVPNTVKPGPAAITTIVPRRFEYSTTEYSVNATQVQAAVSRQGPDLLTTPMWWDKNWNNAAVVPTYTAGCGSQ